MPLIRVLAPMTVAVALGLLTGCGQPDSTGPSRSLAASDVDRIASGNGSSSATPSDASSKVTNPSGTGRAGGSSASSASPTSVQGEGFEIPAAAKAHSHEGAKAFVEFYWQTLGKLDANPTAGVLERLTLPSCEPCTWQKQANAQLLKEKAHIEYGKSWKSESRIRSDSVSDEVVVQFREGVERAEKVTPAGRVRLPAKNNDSEVLVVWTNSGWKIANYGTEKK